MQNTEAPNSENFTLPDFLRSDGVTLHDRVAPFSDYLRLVQSQGKALYAREIVGPSAPRVQVKDSITGKICEMVMMGSNNYLGLANHPDVRRKVKDCVDQNGVGMGGAPLLNGMSSLHRELERRLAKLKGKEDALIFSSGFQANLGWVTSLLRSQDHLICDELHHASMFDGIRIARSSQRFRVHFVRHNDVADYERALKSAKASLQPGGQIFIAVEGVYSMDGDLAPLGEITALAKEFQANIVLDDAHGTGVLGRNGGGSAEHFGVSRDIPVMMGTFSKVFGVTGGFIAGDQALIDYLRYFSRSYMFSAHLPQVVVAAVLAGLDLVEREPALRTNLFKNVDRLVNGLNRVGYKVAAHSAIIPLLLPADLDVRAFGRRIHEEGLFANLIEPPAVPKEAQRVRLSVMADHTERDIDFAISVLEKLGKEFRIL